MDIIFKPKTWHMILNETSNDNAVSHKYCHVKTLNC